MQTLVIIIRRRLPTLTYGKKRWILSGDRQCGGDQLNIFIKILEPKGKIVFYGAPHGLLAKLDMYRMFWNQLSLLGSTMGNDDEVG